MTSPEPLKPRLSQCHVIPVGLSRPLPGWTLPLVPDVVQWERVVAHNDTWAVEREPGVPGRNATDSQPLGVLQGAGFQAARGGVRLLERDGREASPPFVASQGSALS
jgi:hypothetical protein